MELTFTFLLVALAAYVLFGGADFGGGMLEATLWRHPRLKHHLQATLAPVWEANHVWLIAVIVILFVGFPVAYARMCTLLFVPLSLALLGIILRGAFFTFRKYDPEPERHERTYTLLFRVSSVIPPTFFGFMAAALLTPFPTGEGLDFADLYLTPWLTPMGVLCALFMNALLGYLASVFFYGEVDTDADRTVIRRRILLFFAATFLIGGAVLGWGMVRVLVDPEKFTAPVQIGGQVAAFTGIVWLVHALKHRRTWHMRFAAGMQTLAILGGWAHMRHPVLIAYADGSDLTLADSAAPPVTLFWLNIGLVVVLSLVLPLLVYLYRVFQRQET